MLPSNRQDLQRRDEVYLFGFNLTYCSPASQFISLCAAVFILYCSYGFMQELIFRLPGMKPFGWYLTFVQFLIYSLLGTVEIRLTTDCIRRIPYKMYFQLAFYTCATMGLSNASVGKRFNRYDVSAACLMSFGLILFTLADSSVSPNFDPRGYIMVCLALVADAIIGNVQEKEMKKHNASNSEVVFYSYSIGSIYILVGILASGEIFPAFTFFAQNPLQTYGYALIFSLLGYLGISVVLTLVKTQGALIAVTVTTMRKAVTIVLSFIFFAKPFTINYVFSGLIVLFSIYLNVYSKNSAKIDMLLRSVYYKRKVSKKESHETYNV
ncbi:UAA transporter domain containing protein [Aphelenchoides bicaudatus]|nr:UAA transporter domain containing protein [Aphelenchoides bicaudatus]